MEKVMREILAELTTRFARLGRRRADGSRPFHVYCDACVDGFGATL